MFFPPSLFVGAEISFTMRLSPLQFSLLSPRAFPPRPSHLVGAPQKQPKTKRPGNRASPPGDGGRASLKLLTILNRSSWQGQQKKPGREWGARGGPGNWWAEHSPTLLPPQILPSSEINLENMLSFAELNKNSEGKKSMFRGVFRKALTFTCHHPAIIPGCCFASLCISLLSILTREEVQKLPGKGASHGQPLSPNQSPS